MIRRCLICLSLFMTAAVSVYAQNFEGLIEFKKQTGTNVVNYVYYVKDNKVRIDEFTPGTRTVSGSFIIDIKDSSMIYLSHERKVWGTRQPKGGLAAPAGAKAMVTKNSKELFGYKCVENVVKNETDGSQISYWIAPGKFMFFKPMMGLLARQENFSTYYYALAVKDGSMPLLAIEKDANGNEIGRLEVTRLEQKVLAAGLFDTPKDYTELK